MNEIQKKLNKVNRAVPKAALLELLAEESSEVTHAALKVARIIRGDCPTPVSYNEAMASLEEEMTDFILTADCLGIELHEFEKIYRYKLNRFIRRCNL